MRSLTPRQQQVIELVGQGKTGKVIGEALGISPKTVMHHVTEVCNKLGAENRSHAVSLFLAGRR